METLIAALIADPIVQTFIEGLVIKVVAQLLHRRSVDPDYLQRSDAAFAALQAAKTDEERENAQKTLQSLLAS